MLDMLLVKGKRIFKIYRFFKYRIFKGSGLLMLNGAKNLIGKYKPKMAITGLLLSYMHGLTKNSK